MVLAIESGGIKMSKYRNLSIYLTEDERSAFEAMVRKGNGNAMEIRRANVLLMADRNRPESRMRDVDIAKALGITSQAIHDIKDRFLESRKPGEENASPVAGVSRKKRENPPVPPKCTGEVEAKITALACSAPPEGYSKWTLRLLSEKSVELQIIGSISHTQVGRILRKTGLSLT